jgi:hypothetical protein
VCSPACDICTYAERFSARNIGEIFRCKFQALQFQVEELQKKTTKYTNVWVSGVLTPLFLPSARNGGEWLASRPDRFTPDEQARGTYRIGIWVGTKAGLEFVEEKKSLTHSEN